MSPARTVLMIRPVKFKLNQQTIATNDFQKKSKLTDANVQTRALQEFQNLAKKLQKSGIEVIEIIDTKIPEKPDSIFPNNWFTTHKNGEVILFPMLAENRRLERRLDIFETLSKNHNFQITSITDLSFYEQEYKFLEGTGSMVLDHKNKIIYATLSPRTHLKPLQTFAKKINHDYFIFETEYPTGKPVYHTNVVMATGQNSSIICLDLIKNNNQRQTIQKKLQSNHRKLINISIEQLGHFAGNMLQLQNKEGQLVWVMSQQAYKALHPDQIAKLSADSQIIYSDISTIENIGGGSARCMMAEIFLPKK
ncbi:hypothetical protein A2307_05095 [Candidatus Peregrinibacteria bacterium RIFOXYB2_FULL_33_20]|nr:MAG: hypothetical protein A2307_05095 [Candidatus Peregrinibacteria bacterium RIFOXYB2_FULL_33_20]